MEIEMNYLSVRIENLDTEIIDLQEHLDKGNGCGGRIGVEYKNNLFDMHTEKNILENILNKLTIIELT